MPKKLKIFKTKKLGLKRTQQCQKIERIKKIKRIKKLKRKVAKESSKLKKNRCVINKKKLLRKLMLGVVKKLKKIKIVKQPRVKKGRKIKHRIVKKLTVKKIKPAVKQLPAKTIKKITKSNSKYNYNKVSIKVIGIGGGGGNAVTNMINKMRGALLESIDFIAINTSIQDLELCKADTKIHIGKNLTKGLGTGMNSELGRQAIEETRSEIIEAIKGADLVFITAGLGGGTGTGGIATVAEIAQNLGALTIAIVTKPFSFEGAQRAEIAKEGLLKLKGQVDILITIPNDQIFATAPEDITMLEAFKIVDGILYYTVQGIAELIALPGIINVDFADVKAIMQDADTAFVGMGAASGPERAIEAVTKAIHSPLLETSIRNAKNVLLGIFGPKDLGMVEIQEIAKVISEIVDPSAKIILGAYHNQGIETNQIKVILVATGFD